MAEGSPTPTYPQYTNIALDEGLFDQIMAAVRHHIDIEWKNNRISGDKYAEVYLNAMQAALGNSTQYLLGILLLDEQADKIRAEIELIDAQIELAEAQKEKIDKEIEFLEAKILSELANTDETIADPGSLIGRQTDLLRIQGLGFSGDLEAKAAKLHADYDSVFQSVQEVPEAATLSTNAINAIDDILTTVSEMKT